MRQLWDQASLTHRLSLGVVRTAIPNMDRETQEEFLVVIQAKDMGGHMGGLSGSTTVTVTLSDVNDNPPKFPQSKGPVPPPEPSFDHPTPPLSPLEKPPPTPSPSHVCVYVSEVPAMASIPSWLLPTFQALDPLEEGLRQLPHSAWQSR